MLTAVTFMILFSNALVTKKEKSIFYSRTILLLFILVIYINYNNLYFTSMDKGIGLYGGSFNITPTTQVFNMFLFTISAIILLHNSFYFLLTNSKNNIFFSLTKLIKFITRKDNTNYNFLKPNLITKTLLNNTNISKQYTILEYPLILLFITLGSVFVMSSGDLISLFISIELQSYALYIICTLYRNSENAIKGSLIYFLLGGLSSCFILLGSAIIYINTGTTSLEGIFVINSITEVLSKQNNILLNNDINYILPNIIYNFNYINLSLIFLAVGFLFKISAAPFHFWSPNVYDSIPTIITTTVAIIAKLSIFVILLDFIYFINKDCNTYTWKNSILISSLFSLILGSILGLTEKRIKRVYAYSTISHIGFILLSLSIDSIESIQAYIFYTLTYSISNLNAFFILIVIGYTVVSYYLNNNDKLYININNIKDIHNSPVQLVSQLKGYFYVNPYLALSLSITLFSFMGIPPLVGFFAKQMVLSSALDKGYIFITIIAILTSVISAAYYLNIIKYMFFFKNNQNENYFDLQKYTLNINNIHVFIKHNDKYTIINNWLSVIISILTLAILLFIFTPNETLNIAKILSILIFK